LISGKLCRKIKKGQSPTLPQIKRLPKQRTSQEAVRDNFIAAAFFLQGGDVMLLENIKNAIHLNITELFAVAAIDELTGDTDGYRAKLETIAKIAELLGMETEITTVTLDLKHSLPPAQQIV
jgi:hypothetical protein